MGARKGITTSIGLVWSRLCGAIDLKEPEANAGMGYISRGVMSSLIDDVDVRCSLFVLSPFANSRVPEDVGHLEKRRVGENRLRGSGGRRIGLPTYQQGYSMEVHYRIIACGREWP